MDGLEFYGQTDAGDEGTIGLALSRRTEQRHTPGMFPASMIYRANRHTWAIMQSP